MTESIYRGFAQADLEREYNPAANIANVGELRARRQGVAEPGGVVAPGAQQRFRFWQGVDHQSRAFVIAHLPSLSRITKGRPCSSQTA
jgi:hypothetical protein